MSLSSILLQKQQPKVCQIDKITLDELKEIEELDRLEWQEEKIEEKLKEEIIRIAKNLLDVLDNETIA